LTPRRLVDKVGMTILPFLESPVVTRLTSRSRASARHPAAQSVGVDIAVDVAMLRRVVETISSVGSHPTGFRATGTPEEHAVTEFVAAEMRAIGLSSVGFEDVPVDGWRFRGASVSVEGGSRFECASLAGVPATRPSGVTGELVFVGDGRRDRLDRLDVSGKVVLVDWRRASVWISEIGLELGMRGAAAIIVACLDGAERFQGPDALGTSVGRWHSAAPPMVTIRKTDALELVERCRAGAPRVTVVMDAEIDRSARGRNVVGVFSPEKRGAPIVVGAHHDGWFYGAFDNASGVASMLTIAKGLVEADWRPSRPIWFVSHTAEEYGRLDDDAPWCVGAWHQVAVAHREWGSTVPFYLDIEASGRPEFPLLVLGPVELRRFATRWCREAERAGSLPRGWLFANPSTGTHQWPFQLRGVPGLSVFNWHTDFQRTDYHTTNDTMDRLDFGHLSGLSRLHAALLVAADESADDLLDYRARARDVKRATRLLPDHERLALAAEGYAGNGSRRSFARLARLGFAVDSHGETGYVYEQAARDVHHLDVALEKIEAGDLRAAARAASRVGANNLQRWVSEEVQTKTEQGRYTTRGSWPEKSHLTKSPHLWREIAALRSESGARTFGPWVQRSLERHRRRMDAEVGRRAARLAAALSPDPALR
jgi:Peptidase family M28/PA domain